MPAHPVHLSASQRLRCLPPAGAGFPSPAQDYAEASVDLVDWLAPNRPSTFTMRVSGKSMVHAGILDGDMVIVDRARKPKSGQIVIALHDGGFIIRQLVRGEGGFALKAMCAHGDTIEINEDTEIWGPVIGLARKLCTP
jgi:DNA polymerase V